VLHGRLTLLTAAAVAIALPACSEGGAIEENVVRPGITAITEDAPTAACTANASVLQNAIDAYTMLEGGPPPDEQALVDAGYLRETTSDWNVVDGELAAENPACGPVPDEAPIATLDIVTATEPLGADELYATFDQNQIESVGGEACARELAAIIAAAETFLAERAAEPADIDELVASGYLAATPELWALVDAQLVPTDDSGCTDLR
jgi:hypothetical protein